MRLTNYRVARADGSEFTTPSYEEALRGGRIIETFFTEYSFHTPTEEELKETENHIRKVDEYLKSKRG